MKKILAICLSFIILISCNCINVYANDNQISEKQRLKNLVSHFDEYYEEISQYNGLYSLYSDISYTNEKVISRDDTASENECLEAYNSLIYKATHRTICAWYAEDTLLNAEKLENYNNWYSEENWNEFQEKIIILRNAFNGVPYSRKESDYNKDLSKVYDLKKITDAFLDLNDVYNKMTNENFIKGDVNGDGTANILDATMIQKYITGKTELTGAQIMRSCVGEVNSKKSNVSRKFDPLKVDYTKITVLDAIAIQKYSAGKIEDFPDYGITLKEAVKRAAETNQGYDETFIRRHLLNYTISPRSGFEDNFHFAHNELFNGYYYVGPSMKGFL